MVLVLLLLLLLLVGGVTYVWWGPGAFEQGAAKVLRQFGFSDTELALERISLSRLNVAVARLRYEGVTVSDAGLVLGYDLKGLRSRELEEFTVAHPKVDIDLSHHWPSLESTFAATGEPAPSSRIPERFPVRSINFNDAVITLSGADWERTVGLNVRWDGQEQFAAEVALEGEGVRIDARADGLWSDFSGRFTATAKVEKLAELVEFGRDRGWLSLPEGCGFTVEPLEIEAGADFAEHGLQDWNLSLFNQGVTGSVAPARFSAGRTEIEVGGNGREVAQLDLKLGAGTAGYRDLDLSFDRLLASASSAEALGLRLQGWELGGPSGVAGLGTISASAGDIELAVTGAWQPWHPDFAMANLGLHLRVAQAPLALYTGLGSVVGNWGMEAALSAGARRALTLSTELSGASLAGSGLSLESKHLSFSVRGSLPDALIAVVGVKGGRVTWAEGAGLLTGLEGDFELASLMPLASKGRQALQFGSIQQGDFTTGAGRLSFDYDEQRSGGSPLELELTTAALDGKVRILVEGQVSEPISLSIRVLLDSVQLSEMAALFPQFEGRIEGVASGELALRLEGTRIVLQPGGVRLAAGQTGRFQYLRQGWLTQDPQLNPEIFVQGRDIVKIMQDPQGAPALTELALRDLKMSEFRLELRGESGGNQSVMAEIKGERSVKGVTVPVVLNVPIRGDVKETINAVFEFNTRM